MIELGEIDTVAVTGHRPDKLACPGWAGYAHDNPLRCWIRTQLTIRLTALRPRRAISGMALGIDQDFAEVCTELAIPWVAAIPFKGQERTWPPASRQYYQQLLATASELVVVSEGGYSRDAMMLRNAWMVDRCDVLLAVWDASPGGTANTVHYAHRVGRLIQTIDPNEFRKAT